MATNISGKNLEVTDAIKTYIEEKTAALQKHHTQITTIDVEIDKTTHHHKGNVFHVRMNVQIPHHLLCAEETQDDMYAAIDLCRDEIARQLKKEKGKRETQRRTEQKTRRSFKSIFRFLE